MARNDHDDAIKTNKHHRNFQRNSHHHHHNHRSKLLLMISITLAATLCLLSCRSASALTASQTVPKSSVADQLIAQARVGGLDPADYIDEAGELEVMANQQQIPTGQLMAAAGHPVPDNFFLPGSSIPTAHYLQQLAIHQRYLQAQQLQAQQQQQLQAQQQQQQQLHNQHNHQQLQQQQQQQQQQEQLLQAASQQQARVVAAPARYAAGQRVSFASAPIDLLYAAAAEHHHQQQQQQPEVQQQQQQHQQHGQSQVNQLIDFNGYQLTAQPDPRDAGAQMDLVDFLAAPTNLGHAQIAAALYEPQLHAHQQQQQQTQAGDQQLEHMSALASNQQHEVAGDSAEHYQLASNSAAIGPDYQLIDQQQQQQQQQYGQQSGGYEKQEQQRPYGLPTKSSSKEPPGMLKPLGNPKTISSPAIDFVAHNLPKTNHMQALADKLPAHQTPTVFSFSSSKDPSEKVRAVNQKKRTVMRQAEQMAKLMIKSINDKFGTTLGDQTDIPFLLSSLGPLGMAQNILLDPTLLVTLLNSAEKTYFSDVLPGPAKNAIRPVLNLFRVPNKKRDKANLLNIISYLASGSQTSTSVPSKHRQSFGIEKAAASSSSSKSSAATKSATSTATNNNNNKDSR